MNWLQLSTGKGDDGLSQWRGCRVPKHALIFDLLGEIDMANALLGLCPSCPSHIVSAEQIQRWNRDFMGALYTHRAETFEELMGAVDTWLGVVASWLNDLGKPPDGWMDYKNPWGAACCQIRKAERVLSKLAEGADIPDVALPYLNRLSKLLFLIHAYHEMVRNK